jgi:hypothetical protein
LKEQHIPRESNEFAWPDEIEVRPSGIGPR